MRGSDIAKPLEELSWTGPISSIGRILFWGEHRFIIESLPSGKIRLTNKEKFGGLLTLVISDFLKHDVREAYEDANLALKLRAEERDSASELGSFQGATT